MRLLLGFAVSLLMTTPFVYAQAPHVDALDYLRQVELHYQRAQSVHIEMTSESSSRNSFRQTNQKSSSVLYSAPGGRIRAEGSSPGGSSLLVSDGKTEWLLLRSFNQYTSQPTGSLTASKPFYNGDVGSVLAARRLKDEFLYLTADLRSAHYLPPAVLQVNGHKLHCVVIEIRPEDHITDSGKKFGTEFKRTLWIDSASMNLVRQDFAGSALSMQGGVVAPFGEVTERYSSTTYNVTDLDFRPAPDTFVFTPPANSTLVEKLPIDLMPPASAPR